MGLIINGRLILPFHFSDPQVALKDLVFHITSQRRHGGQWFREDTQK